MYIMYIYDILLPYVNLIIVKMTFSKSSVNFYVSNLNNAKAHFSSEIRLLKHFVIFFFQTRLCFQVTKLMYGGETLALRQLLMSAISLTQQSGVTVSLSRSTDYPAVSLITCKYLCNLVTSETVCSQDKFRTCTETIKGVKLIFCAFIKESDLNRSQYKVFYYQGNG